MNYTLGEISDAISGRLYSNGDLIVNKVVIDSRESTKGCLFVALLGERVDGLDFVYQAFQKGASGAIVSRVPEEFVSASDFNFGLIVVDDPQEALARFAFWHRMRCNVEMICITGSAGKTTTKDMISYVVKEKFCTVNTEGNRNNEIGLPLTVLEIKEDTQIAVAEMGMRGFHQIETLCAIARPGIGVITNIGNAHMELLGSRENIAEAKWELVESLPQNGLAILNGDDDQLRRLMKNAKCRVMTFGFDRENSVFASDLETTSNGTYFCANINDLNLVNCGNIHRVFVPIPGRHNVLNALVAVCVGLVLQMKPEEIVEGLAKMESSPMRMKVHETEAGYTVIDDSYNANPEAMKCAIEAALEFADVGKRTVMILGGMVELGEFSSKGHESVGEFVARHSVDVLITTGELAKTIALSAMKNGMDEDRVHICVDNKEALMCAKQIISKGDVVLIKGSRAIGTDKIVEGLI